MLQLIGAAGSLMSRRRGMVGRGDKSPMVSVTNVDPDRIAELLEEFSHGRPHRAAAGAVDPQRQALCRHHRHARAARPVRAVLQQDHREGRGRTQEQDSAAARSSPRSSTASRSRSASTRRGWPTASTSSTSWAEQDRPRRASSPTRSPRPIFVKPVDWVAEVERLHDAGAKWIVDLGPSDTATRLTAPGDPGPRRRYRPRGHPGRASATCSPSAPSPRCRPPWSSYAPTTVKLPDGSVKLSTKFTRLTGRSPILLAGMTPTTVDAKIVAAAANAGHWAELAGGGQVTEEIFEDRIAELTGLLEPGRAVQFNSLFLDPYLWKLQVGGKRLVQRARQSGAPIDGVVVSAGIPDLEDAVELIDELNSVGISHVVFKPGTVDQIKSVINIAAEVPGKDVIVHIEGGRAGGHHSWEDLDDLLLATYADLRKLPNITICVGGGIGTPERAAEYLSGRWAEGYGFPAMPVDGILVGTAAMATLESTTSPAVKQMLVETNGTDHWISAGKAQGGMASSRSQLGADIHEIDNTASRCGRLLDEVAGDAEAVAARRDELIAAMANTAKPYFGDVGDMTYLQWLQRYVELAIGDGDSTADTASPGSPWIAETWRERFAEMLKRAEARLHQQDSGPIETLFNDEAVLDTPDEAIAALLARYPDAETLKLHPADVPWFVTLCKTLGKPVNFVPVIDKDVRRWWRSDSLWQAHDARYTADQVCIIPGTQSVAGITRVDEPVGELLDRFEQAAIDDVLASDGQPASGGLAPPGPRRRHRSACGGARLTRRAVGRPHRHQPGAPHRCARRVAGQREPQCHTPIHRRPARAGRGCRHTQRAAERHLDRHPVHAAVLHGRRRYAGGDRRGRVRCDAVRAGHRGRCRRTRLPAGGAGQHRQGHRSVESGGGRRPHRCHRHVRGSAGSRAHPGARRAGRPLLACGFRHDRRGRHRRRVPGRRGSAEPGAPGSCGASAHHDAEDTDRIDRHGNGFGGHRHRVRPRHPGFGDDRRRAGHGAGQAGGALRDPRPHRRRRARRPAARRRRDHRQRDRHPAQASSRRHGHRADGHERVRGGLRGSQPDPHRPRRRAVGRAEIAHRARHVAVGGRAARCRRHRRQARPARPGRRLDLSVPRHGASRRRHRVPRRPRRNRPRRRDRRGHREGRTTIW